MWTPHLMSLICRCSQMLSASGKKLNLKSLKKLEWTRSPWWEAWGMEDDGSDGTRQPSRLWHFEIFWVWTTWSGLDAEESPRNWEMRNPLTQRWNDKNLRRAEQSLPSRTQNGEFAEQKKRSCGAVLEGVLDVLDSTSTIRSIFEK